MYLITKPYSIIYDKTLRDGTLYPGIQLTDGISLPQVISLITLYSTNLTHKVIFSKAKRKKSKTLNKLPKQTRAIKTIIHSCNTIRQSLGQFVSGCFNVFLSYNITMVLAKNIFSIIRNLSR